MSTLQAPNPDGTQTRVEYLGRLPIIQGPYSRYSSHWFTWQTGPCADHERDWTMCAARVGTLNAKEDCKQYHDDFVECAYRIKTMQRYNAIQAERKKQGKVYADPPPPDSIRTWVKKDN